MGAAPAVQILYGKRLAAIADDKQRRGEQLALEQEYSERFASPFPSAERGYVDAVIPPADTRRALAGALARLVTKQESSPSRRHSNSPL
jgi:propionyl-CoA carboxylase beta chain